MQNFDIQSLLQFSPAEYMCERCYALLMHRQLLVEPFAKTGRGWQCPVCRTEYLPTDAYKRWNVVDYLTARGLEITWTDLIEHSRTLAGIAAKTRYSLNNPNAHAASYAPIRALFDALLSATKFVHFTTFGISATLIGAVKMTAQRVSVRGIISNADSFVMEELTKYKDEAPMLEVKLFERSNKHESWETDPHQKLIIIDGLLAFKGAANMTANGWRKAAQSRDFIEVETDVKKVVELHNRLFSPIWGESGDDKSITMSDGPDDIPF
jgi:hypothetical protein